MQQRLVNSWGALHRKAPLFRAAEADMLDSVLK